MLYHSSPLTTELGRSHRERLITCAEHRRMRRTFRPMSRPRALAPPRPR